MKTGKLDTNVIDVQIRAITYSSSMNVDASYGNKFSIVLEGNGTIENPINSIDGKLIIFRLRQDTFGGRTPIWGNKYRFRGDLNSVVLSTDPNIEDRVAFEYVSQDDMWDCVSFIKGS